MTTVTFDTGETKCAIAGCTNPRSGANLICNHHRYLRSISREAVPRPPSMNLLLCSVPYCNNLCFTNYLCNKHHLRRRRKKKWVTGPTTL
jgi:hypothetical protein